MQKERERCRCIEGGWLVDGWSWVVVKRWHFRQHLYEEKQLWKIMKKRKVPLRAILKDLFEHKGIKNTYKIVEACNGVSSCKLLSFVCLWGENGESHLVEGARRQWGGPGSGSTLERTRPMWHQERVVGGCISEHVWLLSETYAHCCQVSF